MHNYKFFILLGVYGCIGAFIAFATALPELLMSLQEWSKDAPVSPYNTSSTSGCLFLAFGFIAILLFLLLGSMLNAHMPLALQNMTSIEECYDNANPYDCGDSLSNLAQAFGAFGPDWFLPVMPHRPLTDGISFYKSYEDLPAGLMEGEDSDGFDYAPAPEDLWRYRYMKTSGASRQVSLGN